MRTPPAELGRVVGEQPRIEGLEPGAARLEPDREGLQVEPVGAPGRVREARRGEKALDRGPRLHEAYFAPSRRTPAEPAYD